MKISSVWAELFCATEETEGQALQEVAVAVPSGERTRLRAV